MEGHERYSSADREGLARAVGRLLGFCDCYAGARRRRGGQPPGPPAGRASPGTRRACLGDGMTYCAFEEGSGVEVTSLGQASFHRTTNAGQCRDGIPQRRAGPGRIVPVYGIEWPDSGPAATGRSGDAPMAPLPAAFRTLRAGHTWSPGARFPVPPGGRGGACAEEVMTARPAALRTSLLRAKFEQDIPVRPSDIERAIKSDIWAREDAMCLDRLFGLGEIGEKYAYGNGSTLEGLAGFVSRLNGARPLELCLDTVIVNLGMYMALFPGTDCAHSWDRGYPYYDGEPRYQNMYVLDGIAFLHHPRIPRGAAYALSSAQGPVFVHGPSSIHGTRDEIVVTRHCGIVEPPECPDVPWGVRFGAERDKGADNVRADEGE